MDNEQGFLGDLADWYTETVSKPVFEFLGGDPDDLDKTVSETVFGAPIDEVIDDLPGDVSNWLFGVSPISILLILFLSWLVFRKVFA